MTVEYRQPCPICGRQPCVCPRCSVPRPAEPFGAKPEEKLQSGAPMDAGAPDGVEERLRRLVYDLSDHSDDYSRWRHGEVKQSLTDALSLIESLTKERDALAEGVGRCEKALRFYEAHAEGCRKVGSLGEPHCKALNDDGGKTARAALRGKEGYEV